MIKNVEIRTTIKDYKEDKKNEGKIAIYHIDTSTVIFEGEEYDWIEMNNWVEQKNGWISEKDIDSEVYHLILVPHRIKQIRGFSWR